MKKFIIPVLFIILLLTSCFKEEFELLQSFKSALDVEANITVTNSILDVSDLQNDSVSFIIDSILIDGSVVDENQEEIEIGARIYFSGNNTTSIVEGFNFQYEKEIVFSVQQLADYVGYNLADLAVNDKFTVEVLAIADGDTNAVSGGGFAASIVYLDKYAGVWDVDAESYYGYDETWVVTVYPKDGEESSYYFEGISGGRPVLGVVDTETDSISFAAHQELGNITGRGMSEIVYKWGADDNPIQGARFENDSMFIPNFSVNIVDVYFWDNYTTVWKKR